MRNEEIFNLAETHGWMDDFGRWNFKDEGLIGFVLELLSLETKPETSTVSEKREWVGLTTEEIESLVEIEDWYNYPEDFVRTVQARLKEKNT